MIVPDLIKAVEAGQEKARLEIQGKHRMNERIRELAEQANILIGKDSYGKFAVIPGHEKDPLNRQGKAESHDALEKFAELIVRECADRATWAQDTNAKDIGGEVLKHFGVDE